MASDDIYRVTIHYEGPSQAVSTGMYYFEDAPRSSGISDTEQLNETFQAGMRVPLVNALSSQYRLVSSVVRKVFGPVDVPNIKEFTTNVGGRPGNSLPANNSIVMSMIQTTFPRASNGRMFIPGISEADTETGVFANAYLVDQLAALATALASQRNEVGGTGVWLPVVISAKIRDAVPGQKDWPASVGSLVAIEPQPLIARQIRRATRVRGAFV